MLAQRMVRLIENHSNELASSLVERLRHSSRTAAYLQIPPDDLRQEAFEIYHHLGDWLMNKTETDVEYRFVQVGQRRAEENIPMCDFVWAVIITKENLWRFLQLQTGADSIFEIFGEMELLQVLDQFFDRALYYATVGYTRCTPEKRPARAA